MVEKKKPAAKVKAPAAKAEVKPEPKAEPKAMDPIKVLLDPKFAAALDEAITAHESDIIRTPLLNVRGDLSHLRDALHQVESLERNDG